MSIDGVQSSGTFHSCSFKGNSLYVSRHAHVGHLRLSAVNVSDAFCVLFRTFVFEKSSDCPFVRSMKCTFMIFGFCSVAHCMRGFCSVAHCMRMSHGYFRFSSFTKLYDRSVFAGRK